MTTRHDLRLLRLAQLADLLHKSDLQRLADARAAADETRRRLESLSQATNTPDQLDLLRAQMLHDLWAASRKRRLEAELRTGEALQESVRTRAALSLARSQILNRMKSRPDQPS
jgi:hypothetical protein